MAIFSLREFQTQVLSRGLARTNRFELVISLPAILGGRVDEQRVVSLLCETASLPLLNINVKPHRIYGPNYQRPITSEYGGEGIPFTFHVDREMKVKRFFEDWMEFIINRNSYNVAYQSQYVTTIEVNQLDEQNNITYSASIEDAFPRNLNLMELNNAAQNQTHRLTVLFAYRRWTRTELKQRKVAVPSVPFIPVVDVAYITPTPTSRILNVLGTPDTNVDFSESTFEVPAA